MKTKQALILGLPLIASCLFLAVRRGYTEPVDNRLVRLAELEIYPDQLNSKAALRVQAEGDATWRSFFRIERPRKTAETKASTRSGRGLCSWMPPVPFMGFCFPPAAEPNRAATWRTVCAPKWIESQMHWCVSKLKKSCLDLPARQPDEHLLLYHPVLLRPWSVLFPIEDHEACRKYSNGRPNGEDPAPLLRLQL
jgi:hypothetical protein